MSWFSKDDQSGYTADDNWDWDTFAFYDKNDLNESSLPDTTSVNDHLTIKGEFNDEGELKSGSFTTDDPINFYSTKAGNSYDLYWSNPASSSIDWGPTDKGMSHISAWTVGGGSAPVPEPETWAMLGFGLLGLLLVGRKQKLFQKT